MNSTGKNILFIYLTTGMFFSWMLISENHQSDFTPFIYKLSDSNDQSELLIQKNNFISDAELKINAPENCFILFSVNGGKWEKTDSLNFNGSFIEKSEISLIPTSYKWKNPVGEFPHAAALRYCFVSLTNNERSKMYYYFTSDKKHLLSVISVQSDISGLFGFSEGIYIEGRSGLTETENTFMIPWWKKNANFHQKGNEWERAAGFQFFDENGINQFSSEAGLRIHGNATRAYPQKSLRLSASKKYGNSFFDFPFFEKNDHTKYHHLIMRNGGNDWDRTLIADGVIHELIRPTGLDIQSYTPVVVYINGEYWGIHSMRERIDENYLAEKYNVKKKSITVLDGKILSYGKEEELNDFNELLSFCINNEISDSEKVEKIKSEINYENFIKYISLQIYFANTDWPANNVKQYKLTGKNSGTEEKKWKWMIWDMDYAYGYTGKDAVNTDMFQHISKSGTSVGILFSVLMNDRKFRSDLKEQILLQLNTTLKTETQINLLDSFAAEIENEMDRHTRRWRKPSDVDQWQENINDLKEFISKRTEILFLQSEKYLEDDLES